MFRPTLMALACSAALTATISLAQAQTTPPAGNDVRQDQRDIRQDRRDFMRDRANFRQDNRDIRQDRREISPKHHSVGNPLHVFPTVQAERLGCWTTSKDQGNEETQNCDLHSLPNVKDEPRPQLARHVRQHGA